MPQVAIQVRGGRDPQSIRRLINAVTAAVASSLGAPLETIRVIVTEVSATHWANGDVTLAERDQAAGRGVA